MIRPALLILIALLAAGCAATGTNGESKTSDGPPPIASRHHTDRDLDLAIDGDGYFIVQTPAGGYLFTRNGGLAVDSTGELVNDDGYRLWPPVNVSDGASGLSIQPDGVVRRKTAEGVEQLAGQIVLSRFNNPAGLDRDGIYYLPTSASGDPITAKPGAKGLGKILVGELEE